MKKIITASVIVVMLVTIISSSNIAFAQTPGIQTQLKLHGWAWSWTTGWIKLSSNKIDSNGNVQTDHDNSITYGPVFKKNNQTNYIGSGYAWSPNVGWISFNESDIKKSGTGYSACAGADGLPASVQTAQLEPNGDTFKLLGTARVLSAIQIPAGVSANHWNGNWDGCVYFNSEAMPLANLCNISFGVTFTKFGTTDKYFGSGFGWNAGGVKPIFNTCASVIGLGLGGLSYINFGGSNYVKSVLVHEEMTMDVDIDIPDWNPVCKTVEGNTVNKTVTVNYSISPVEGTICQLTRDGVNYPMGVIPSSGTGSVTVGPFSPDGQNLFKLTCTNPATKNVTGTDTITLSCTECSNFKDDPSDADTDADEDDLSCRVSCGEEGVYTPGGTSEKAGTNGNTNCEKEPSIKGIPQIKEN